MNISILIFILKAHTSKRARDCSNLRITGLLPFFSSVLYIGHSTTPAEGHSLPCLSPVAYGSLGGIDCGTPDIPLTDYQTPPSSA